MVRFDPSAPASVAATAAVQAPGPAKDAPKGVTPGLPGLAPYAARPGLDEAASFSLVRNASTHLARLERALATQDTGRAASLVRQLDKHRDDLRAAMDSLAVRDDPDAGLALRELHDAVQPLRGRSPDVDAMLARVVGSPNLMAGLAVDDLRAQVTVALTRSADFMARGRPDLGQLADRAIARWASAPYYEVRARLREFDVHLATGRPEFAALALDELEETLRELEGRNVRTLKPLAEDPAPGAQQTVDDLKALVTARRDELAALPRRSQGPVDHATILDRAAEATAHLAPEFAASAAAEDPHTPELRAGLRELRGALLDASRMSRSDAEFLAACLDWQVEPADFVRAKLMPAAAEFIQITNGHGLGSLHRVSNERRGPVAGYGGVDVGPLNQPGELWHEMAHHFEYALPEGFEMAWSFVRSRASHERPEYLYEIAPENGFPPELKGYDAPMIHPYATVVRTDRRSTETVSMGLEHLYEPGAMTDLAVKDRLHLQYAIGLLLGV